MSLFSKALVRRDDGEAALHHKLDQVLASDYTPREKNEYYFDELFTAKEAAKKAERKQREEMRELLTPTQPAQVGFSDAQFQELRRLLVNRPAPTPPPPSLPTISTLSPTVFPTTPTSRGPSVSRISRSGEVLRARRSRPFSSPITTPRSLEGLTFDEAFFTRGSSLTRKPAVKRREKSRISVFPSPLMRRKSRLPVSVKLASEFGVPQFGDDASGRKKRARKPTERYSPPP